MPEYDLVVIGSGPAGEKGAAQAGYFHKKVAVVERLSNLGGAGANTGTLPSKTLRETSLYLSGFRQRGLYGVDMSLQARTGVRELLFRERAVAQEEQVRVAQNLRSHGADVYQGKGRLLDPHTVLVRRPGAEERLTAEIILIATGSTPFHPPLFNFSAPGIYDSDSILLMSEVPHSLVVLGGGVIGCEYACTFAALGIPVTLVEARTPLLSFLDLEMSTRLKARMEGLGVQFRMPATVESVDVEEGRVTVGLEGGDSIAAAALLVASGRSANTAGMGLEEAGVKLGERGRVLVDEHYQTSVPNIYAAGDCVGFPALASTSMEQARVAMAHAFNLYPKDRIAPVLPYGLYTIPELSMAGETEESCKQAGIEYVVGRAAYATNARGQIIGDGGGFLKLIFRRVDMKLLGVHVIGEQASELVHTGLTALLCGAGAQLFIDTCYNYPTLSELYKYATYNAMAQRNPV
ncbi:MAG: Si-specific NAD(P)(+) transhydrogenase [Myxococcaceae bacterium]|nr:MAG: Si-specific NAD(P)(+) transhydrogenase [Myxococcaceae bacterium]